jgi:conjugal transfer pilus assembly protein TraW
MKILKTYTYSMLVLLLIYSPYVVAKDYGIKGALFPVVEQNALDMLLERLSDLEDSGKIAELQKQWLLKVRSSAKRPQDAIENIVRATEKKVRYFDPSITLRSDLRDHEGTVFVKAGKVVNPFDYLPGYNPLLLFIDGDDREQVRFAIEKLKEQEELRIILLRGSVLELMEEEGVRMYFDQKGIMADRFGIVGVPSFVEREGLLLKITEGFYE